MRRVESQGESLRCLSSRKQPAIYGIHSDAGGDGDSREPCQGHAVGRGCHWAVALGDLPAQSGSSAKGPGFRRISACLPNEIGRHHADGSGSGYAMIAPRIGGHKQIISYILAHQFFKALVLISSLRAERKRVHREPRGKHSIVNG